MVEDNGLEPMTLMRQSTALPTFQITKIWEFSAGKITDFEGFES